MNKYIYIFIGIISALLTSCGDSKEAYQKSLQQLRETLAQSNDTVYGYSLEKHFAVWIHQQSKNDNIYYEEGEGYQTLYYYDLKSKEQTELFTVNEDTFHIKNIGAKIILKDINFLTFSPDSSALLISDAYRLWGDDGRRSKVYMLPLAKKDTLVELCYEEEMNEDISFDIKDGAHVGPLSRWNGNGFIAWKRTKLPNFINNENAWDYANQLYRYTTNGEEEPLVLGNILGNITISDNAYCLNEDGSYTELSRHILNNADELRREYVLANKYRIEDMFKIAKNEILFDNIFGTSEDKKVCYFELTLKKVLQSRDNPKNYIVKGDGFNFVTSEKLFTQFEYPRQVIIQAHAVDRDRFLRELQSNPFASYLMGCLMGIASMTIDGSAALADMNEIDERFMLSNIELLYY